MTPIEAQTESEAIADIRRLHERYSKFYLTGWRERYGEDHCNQYNESFEEWIRSLIPYDQWIVNRALD